MDSLNFQDFVNYPAIVIVVAIMSILVIKVVSLIMNKKSDKDH